ncbi:hypothetical protein MNBD_GAMMA10-3204 [hydrothermal vent metagenome]|uniref:Uncharacterized protein n=1 Tax=hydrothermal vent metagenome TaxID=652676 RepID=A0A3B0XWQ1_9ZZZZ
MSGELFEVAFSGQVAEGSDMAQVKAKVAAMFKADAAKLEQLFCGKRVVIKKNIDQAMANKYKAALNNAGAVCEVKSLSTEQQAKTAPVEEKAPVKAPLKVTAAAAGVEPVKPVITRVPVSIPAGDIPPAPQTAPLGVSAEEISDLSASLAPVGSEMQTEHPSQVAAEIDVSGLDVAPVGSDLGQSKKGDAPAPPDTDGLSMLD